MCNLNQGYSFCDFSIRITVLIAMVMVKFLNSCPLQIYRTKRKLSISIVLYFGVKLLF